MDQNFSSEKSTHINVSVKKQQDLIQQVVEEGQSIVKIAKKLKLKYSRAKSIVKYYKETGQIMPESKPRTNSKSTRQTHRERQPPHNPQLPSSNSQVVAQNQRQPDSYLHNNPQQSNEGDNMIYFIYPYYQWNPF